ncbi:hypothetical protein C8T65DRAFT_833884 [Cerioporus squamosus]|nr:hypothetical protein C8T65DRAFT_833884 [Cerioporus squamosus]
MPMQIDMLPFELDIRGTLNRHVQTASAGGLELERPSPPDCAARDLEAAELESDTVQPRRRVGLPGTRPATDKFGRFLSGLSSVSVVTSFRVRYLSTFALESFPPRTLTRWTRISTSRKLHRSSGTAGVMRLSWLCPHQARPKPFVARGADACSRSVIDALYFGGPGVLAGRETSSSKTGHSPAVMETGTRQQSNLKIPSPPTSSSIPSG